MRRGLFSLLKKADNTMNQETPETDAMLETDWHRLEEYSAPLSAYKRMTELCREMERERNDARQSATHWRDIATGAFAPSAVLPWESHGENKLLGEP